MAALQEAAYTGLIGGMNLAKPAYELEDNECRYLQDALLDYQGLIRRRGPIRRSSGFPTFAEKGCGIMATLNPAGNYRIALFGGTDSSGVLRMLSDTFASINGSFTWPHNISANPPNFPYWIFDTKPALGGGVTWGVASTSGPIPSITTADNATMGFWHGGTKATYSTGTVSATQGSATITGSGTSWAANVVPGMYLFADVATGQATGPAFRALLGVVKSVDSNTQLTLTNPSPYTTGAGQAYDLQPIRGFRMKIAKGRITTTTSGTTVTGATTKFISQYMDEVLTVQTGTLTNTSAVVTGLTSTTGMLRGMRVTGTNIPANTVINSIDSATQITLSQAATGTGAQSLTFKHGWNIYRASDMGWIGRVGLVNNEISITLAANAALALNNERFVALCSTHGGYSAGNPDLGNLGYQEINSQLQKHKPGFLTASYSGRQWYANNQTKLEQVSRVWFSEPSDPEAVDFAEYDGDYIPAYSTVETDTPVKAIMPAYNGLVVIKENEAFVISGSSPTTFALKKIYDDGTLSGMSVASFAGGVLWAGREGILYYDGIQTQNITLDKLGDYYKHALRNINPNTHRIWGHVQREHYFLFVEQYSPNVAVVKGVKSHTPTAVCIVINMVTGAIGFWTNLAFRGSIETPAAVGKKTLLLVNDSSKMNIVDGSALFDLTGQDEFLPDGTAFIVTEVGNTAASNVSLSNLLPSADQKYFFQITPTNTGFLASVSVRMWVQTTGTAKKFKVGVYSDSSGSPNALLGTSAEVSLTTADGAEGSWREFTFSPQVAVTSGIPVWIGFHSDSGTAVVRVGKTGTLVGGIHTADDAYSDGFEATFGAENSAVDGQLMAYATLNSAGPDFYMESKKYTMGNAMVKKLFKQLSLTYMAQGDSLKLDTVLGNQSIGRTARSEFPQTVYTWAAIELLINTWDDLASQFPTWDALVNANFKPRRIKFLKRSQMLSFRIYQKSQSVTQLQLGPFQFAFKWQRIGRI